MKIIINIILYVLATLYLFDLYLPYLPSYIRSRTLLGVVGLIIFSLNYSKKIHKIILDNIFFLLLLIVPFLLTTLIHSNFDKWGLRPLLNVLVYFGALVIIHYVHRYKGIRIESLINFLVNVLIINIIIAYIAFSNTEVNDFLLSLRGPNVGIRILELSKFRLVGLGNLFFFSGGVFCSWSLLLIVYLIKNTNLNKNILWVKYFIVLVAGMFLARTTMIGFVFSIIYFILPGVKAKKDISFKGVIKVGLLVLAMGTIYILLDNTSLISSINSYARESGSFAHAFEMVLNYLNGKGLVTRSTDQLETMYVYPETLKTWLIGDGFFSDIDGVGYYQSTDVGYLRIIFFMGLFGLIVLYLQKLFLLRCTINLAINEGKKQFTQLVLLMFILTLVLNLKGFADLDVYLFLFFWHYLFLNYEQNIVIK